MHLSIGIVSSLLASTACAVAVRNNEHIRRQSNNTGYELKTPPLDTPWTSTVGTSPWPEYPRPQLARSDWKNLNGVWQYQNASGFDELDSPPFGKDLDQVALVPFCLESGLSGVQGEFLFYSWYRTTFDVPSNWSSDNRVLLNFGAVDYNATVFVNGEQVYNNIGGYFAFTVDITDQLSDQGDNELVVFVFDPTDLYPYNIPLGKQRLLNTDHIFYRPCSGIWQTVWLESAPTENIAHLDLAADMNGQVNVTVHSSKDDSSSQYEIIIYESGSTDVKANATGTVNSPFIFKVDSPKLWSPDSPTLYNITIKLGSDTIQSYTGFRTVSSGLVDGFHRPLLNGNFTFLFGTLDQGFWPDGLYSPPSVEAMVFDLKALKEVGYNMLRKHIKVEPALFYQACDQLGIMLIQDMPALTTFQYNVPLACPNQDVSVAIASNTQQAFNDQLATLIKQHRSYPSIVTWVIYNEGWGQPGYPDITDFELTDLVRSLDPTRLIDSVTGWNDHGAGDYHDNHHYSSPQCGTPFYSTASTPYDGKRIAIQGEFGGIGHNISDEHAWKVQTSIDMVNGTYELDADLTIWNYRAHHIFEELNDQITRFGACSGAVWTQTTDVEGEVNGMLTYDRRLNRMDKDQWKKDIQGLYDAAKNAGKTAGNATMRMMARDELGVGL